MDKKSLFLIILSAALLLAVGLSTGVFLGDECYHWRVAKMIFESNSRPVIDSVYRDNPKLGYFISDLSIWHIALAFLWKISGKVSGFVAQVYQAFYYIILLLSVYLITKKFYGKKAVFYALLITATAPVVVVLSILLYLDLPLTALLALSFLFLVYRHNVWAGIVFGLAIFTKINALFLIPGMLILFFIGPLARKNIITGIRDSLGFSLSAIIVNIPDIYFRLHNFGYIYYTSPKFIAGKMTYYFSPGSIAVYPLNILIYFGIGLLAGMAAYFWLKKDMSVEVSLWVIILSYLLFWVIFFRNTLDVRYLIVLVPFFAILASRGLVAWPRRNWAKVALVLLCLAQFAGACGYVYFRRKIPQGILNGYAYVKQNVAPDSLIMYPGEDMVTYTGRPIAWGRVLSAADLFWGKDEKKMVKVLDEYGIRYIIIKKKRVYDDSRVHHLGGYPRSFVERLPELGFLELKFENEELSVWRVLKAGPAV